MKFRSIPENSCHRFGSGCSRCQKPNQSQTSWTTRVQGSATLAAAEATGSLTCLPASSLFFFPFFFGCRQHPRRDNNDLRWKCAHPSSCCCCLCVAAVVGGGDNAAAAAAIGGGAGGAGGDLIAAPSAWSWGLTKEHFASLSRNWFQNSINEK